MQLEGTTTTQPGMQDMPVDLLRDLVDFESSLFAPAISKVNALMDMGHAHPPASISQVANGTVAAFDAIKALAKFSLTDASHTGIEQALAAVDHVLEGIDHSVGTVPYSDIRNLGYTARDKLVQAKQQQTGHAEQLRRARVAESEYNSSQSVGASAGSAKTVKLPSDLNPHAQAPHAASDPAPHWGRLSPEDNRAAVAGFAG